MRKAMQRIKKMTFQSKKHRIIEPITEEDKYLIQMASYRQRDLGRTHENIQRITRGGIRPQYI